MIGYLKRAASTDLVQHSMLLSAGTVLAQLIPLVFMLLLSRFYSTASFGLYHLFYQITIIISVIANGRLELAVLTVKNDEDAGQMLKIATKIAVYVSTAVGVAAIFLYLLLPNFSLVSELQYWMFALPVGVFLNAQIMLLSASVNRHKQYKQMVISKLTMVLLTNALPALGIVLHQNTSATMIILGYLAGLLAGVFYLYVCLQQRFAPVLSLQSSDWVALRDHRHFLFFSTPAILVDQLATALPILCFASVYGASATGDFGFAQRILVIPTVLVAAAVSQVFMKEATDYFHQHKNLFSFTLKVFFVLLALGVLPYCVVFIWGQQILPLLFGAQWNTGAQYAVVLTWATVLKFAISPISVVMVVTGHIKLQALWQVLALVGNGILAFVASRWLSALQYLQWLAVLDAVLYLLYLLFILKSVSNKK